MCSERKTRHYSYPRLQAQGTLKGGCVAQQAAIHMIMPLLCLDLLMNVLLRVYGQERRVPSASLHPQAAARLPRKVLPVPASRPAVLDELEDLAAVICFSPAEGTCSLPQ